MQIEANQTENEARDEKHKAETVAKEQYEADQNRAAADYQLDLHNLTQEGVSTLRQALIQHRAKVSEYKAVSAGSGDKFYEEQQKKAQEDKEKKLAVVRRELAQVREK